MHFDTQLLHQFSYFTHHPYITKEKLTCLCVGHKVVEKTMKSLRAYLYPAVAFVIVVLSPSASPMHDRGGAIAGTNGQLEFPCDPSVPSSNAVVVITSDSRCKSLNVTLDYMTADTTVNLYDGSTLDRVRTCGRMLYSSSVGQSITISGATATLVIRKASCTDSELPFKCSWACVDDNYDEYTPQESGSFVNYEEGMISRTEFGTDVLQRQTIAIVSDSTVCLRISSRFSPPNDIVDPCDVQSLSAHRIEEDGCLTLLHSSCAVTTEYQAENVLANILLVSRVDPALVNIDSRYEIEWKKELCASGCQTPATETSYSSTTTAYSTESSTTTTTYPPTTTTAPATTTYPPTTTTTPTTTTYSTTTTTYPPTTMDTPATTTYPPTTTAYPPTTTAYPPTTTAYPPTTTTTPATTTTTYPTTTTTTTPTTTTTTSTYPPSTSTTAKTYPTESTTTTAPPTQSTYPPTTESTYPPTTTTSMPTTTTSTYPPSVSTTAKTYPTESTTTTTPPTQSTYPPTTVVTYPPTTESTYPPTTTTTMPTTPTTTYPPTISTTAKIYPTESTTTTPPSTEITYPPTTESTYPPTTTTTTPTATTTTTPTTTTVSTTTQRPAITVTSCGGKVDIPTGYNLIIDYKSDTMYDVNERCAYIINTPAPYLYLSFLQQYFERNYDGCILIPFDLQKPEVGCRKLTDTDYSTTQTVFGPLILYCTTDYSVVRQGWKVLLEPDYEATYTDPTIAHYAVSTDYSNAISGEWTYPPPPATNYKEHSRHLAVSQSAPGLPVRTFQYSYVKTEAFYDCVGSLQVQPYNAMYPCIQWDSLCGHFTQQELPGNATADTVVTYAWSDDSINDIGFQMQW